MRQAEYKWAQISAWVTVGGRRLSYALNINLVANLSDKTFLTSFLNFSPPTIITLYNTEEINSCFLHAWPCRSYQRSFWQQCAPLIGEASQAEAETRHRLQWWLQIGVTQPETFTTDDVSLSNSRPHAAWLLLQARFTPPRVRWHTDRYAGANQRGKTFRIVAEGACLNDDIHLLLHLSASKSMLRAHHRGLKCHRCVIYISHRYAYRFRHLIHVDIWSKIFSLVESTDLMPARSL